MEWSDWTAQPMRNGTFFWNNSLLHGAVILCRGLLAAIDTNKYGTRCSLDYWTDTNWFCLTVDLVSQELRIFTSLEMYSFGSAIITQFWHSPPDASIEYLFAHQCIVENASSTRYHWGKNMMMYESRMPHRSHQNEKKMGSSSRSLAYTKWNLGKVSSEPNG